MLRAKDVERTQCIDWLDARGRRGDVGPTTSDRDEATNNGHGEKTSEHHHVAHRVRGPSGWLPLASDDVTGEPIEYIQATRGQGRCL